MTKLVLVLSLLLATPGSSLAYLTDYLFHAEPANPPATLVSANTIAFDPTFGTKIVRLTDAGDGTRCMTAYSNSPAFNSDSTKVSAYCDNRLKVWDFNPTTMTRSNPRIQSNPPANLREDLIQWSRLTPNKFYACARAVLYEIVIPSGTSTTWTNNVIRNFNSVIGAQPNDATDYCTQISVSADDNVFAFTYFLNGVSSGFIAYQKNINTVRMGQAAVNTYDEVEIDKSGRWLVSCCFPSKVWDTTHAVPIIPVSITQDDFVHRALGDGVAYTSCATQRLCVRNLATPNSVTPIIAGGWEYDSGTRDDHFSLTNGNADMLACRFRRNGQPAQVAFDNECLTIDTGGSGAVKRYLHHWSNVYESQSPESYWAQPRGNVSIDGRFIAFTSNRDGVDVNARNDVYVADIQQNTKYDPGPIRAAASVGSAVVSKAPRGFTLTFFDAIELLLLCISLIKYRVKLLWAYRKAGEATFKAYWRWKVKRWLRAAPIMIADGGQVWTSPNSDASASMAIITPISTSASRSSS